VPRRPTWSAGLLTFEASLSRLHTRGVPLSRWPSDRCRLTPLAGLRRKSRLYPRAPEGVAAAEAVLVALADGAADAATQSLQLDRRVALQVAAALRWPGEGWGSQRSVSRVAAMCRQIAHCVDDRREDAAPPPRHRERSRRCRIPRRVAEHKLPRFANYEARNGAQISPGRGLEGAGGDGVRVLATA
jgi:hypothetical protein